MEDAERDVEKAVLRFYDAIETMVTGGGVDAISDTWHHTNRVTARHPMDEWAVGWDEVLATWKSVAAFGRAGRGGGKVLSCKAYVYGDFAYTTIAFQAAPSWGGDKLMCTNVLSRVDGIWKVIHHHVDPSPNMQSALEKMLSE